MHPLKKEKKDNNVGSLSITHSQQLQERLSSPQIQRKSRKCRDPPKQQTLYTTRATHP